jgi:hypothetical protein
MVDIIDEANIIVPAEVNEAAQATKAKKPNGSAWVFSCPKQGHSFDPGQPAMVAQMFERLYGVRICVDCGAPIYMPIGGELSPILDATGDQIRSDS